MVPPQKHFCVNDPLELELDSLLNEMGGSTPQMRESQQARRDENSRFRFFATLLISMSVSELDQLLSELDDTRGSRIAQGQQDQWYTASPQLGEGEDLETFYFENRGQNEGQYYNPEGRSKN